MSRFGDLVRGNSAPTPAPAPAPVAEPVVEEPAVEEVVEEPTAEVEEEVELIPYESDLSLHDMTKKELEEYGRTVGIELDRRHSKDSLVQELEDYLASDS
tara:strand:+ start:556 stop:855 length:300 start_codon:yes stop_codon:yes gene_type:complete